MSRWEKRIRCLAYYILIKLALDFLKTAFYIPMDRKQMLLKGDESNSFNEFQLHELRSDLRQVLQQAQGDGTWATTHFQAGWSGSCICTSWATLLQVPENKINQFLSKQNKNRNNNNHGYNDGCHIVVQITKHLCLFFFKPLFLVSVWTQEASSSALDLWSPTPRSHTAQASCTTNTFTFIVPNIHRTPVCIIMVQKVMRKEKPG